MIKCVPVSTDEVIGKVLSIMKGQNVPYISIYTGLKPSRVMYSQWSPPVYTLFLSDIESRCEQFRTGQRGFHSFVPQVIAEVSAGQPKGRSLLQAMEDTVKAPLMFNDTEGRPCIMLWAQDLEVSFGTGEWVRLANFTPTMDGSQCNVNTSQWES